MVQEGCVGSLANRSGNTTGISILATELDTKCLEIPMELLPKARRLAAVADLAEAVRGHGRLDILVNNAGGGANTAVPPGPPREMRSDGFRKVIDAKLTSAFMLTQAAYPEQKKACGGRWRPAHRDRLTDPAQTRRSSSGPTVGYTTLRDTIPGFVLRFSTKVCGKGTGLGLRICRGSSGRCLATYRSRTVPRAALVSRSPCRRCPSSTGTARDTPDGPCGVVIREIHRTVTWVSRRAQHKTADGLRSRSVALLTGPT